MEINKCKKSLYIQYSSMKICTCITQNLLFLKSKWISGWDPGRCFFKFGWVFFFWMSYKKISEWSCQMEMPTHPKPQLLVLLFVFWVVFCLFLFVLLFVFVCLVFFNPLYIPINLYLTKKLRDQCKFFFCSGMLVMLKYRQTVMARSDTPPSLFSKLRCYQCDFFLCYAPFIFLELPLSSTSQK